MERHRGDAERARRLDDEPAPFGGEPHGRGDLGLGHRDDRVRASATGGRTSARRAPGSASRRRSSARRARPASGTISPRASESRASAASSGSTPITRASGRSALTADGHAARQPAATDRDEHRRQVRQVLDDLEPDRPLAGDDPVVVERRDDRRTRAGPRSSARPAGAPRWRSRRRRPAAPSASTRSRLIAGASDGMTTTAGAPSSRAARATPWAWLPDE